MIANIDIREPKNCPIAWWEKVAWLKNIERITFEPGINILFGPNGSGKSTVLKLLARMLCCEQGGYQVVTYEGIRELGSNKKDGWKLKTGVMPVYDGAPAIYFNPDDAVGLIGGMAGFDYDFGMEGVMNAMFHGSAGQTTLYRANKAMETLITEKWSKVQWKADKKRYEELNKFLVGSYVPESVIPTAIFDEPTRSLDLLKEIGFWMNIPRLAKKHKFQLIVAAHSPFAVNVPGANYIETEPGYLQKCRDNIALFQEITKK